MGRVRKTSHAVINALSAFNDQLYVLTARGYWQAFQSVKKSITDVLNGKDAGLATEDDYSAWYRELFGPNVAAGIIAAADLAGYLNRPVYMNSTKNI